MLCYTGTNYQVRLAQIINLPKVNMFNFSQENISDSYAERGRIFIFENKLY